MHASSGSRAQTSEGMPLVRVKLLAGKEQIGAPTKPFSNDTKLNVVLVLEFALEKAPGYPHAKVCI